MVVIKDKGQYLITCKVLLGDLFEVPQEDAYVELREADTPTSKRMSDAAKNKQDDGGRMVEVFLAELPGLVVSHSFYNPNPDPNKDPIPMSSKEVVALIADRLAVFERVVSEYGEKVLFTQGKKSEPSSST